MKNNTPSIDWLVVVAAVILILGIVAGSVYAINAENPDSKEGDCHISPMLAGKVVIMVQVCDD